MLAVVYWQFLPRLEDCELWHSQKATKGAKWRRLHKLIDGFLVTSFTSEFGDLYPFLSLQFWLTIFVIDIFPILDFEYFITLSSIFLLFSDL